MPAGRRGIILSPGNTLSRDNAANRAEAEAAAMLADIASVDPVAGGIEIAPQPLVSVPGNVVPVDTVAGQTIQTTNTATGAIPKKVNPLMVGLAVVSLLLIFGVVKIGK